LEGDREGLSRAPRESQSDRCAVSVESVASGLNSCSSTGVSNVSAAYLEDLLKLPNVIVPAVNQVERHPSVSFLESALSSETHVLIRSCLATEVLAGCEKAGIVVTAYSPLGSDESPLLKNDVVIRIAEKYDITPANVLVSFQVNTPNVNGEEHLQATDHMLIR
jgi:diketogulonate reductase-like aldo/keto reductase